MTFGPFKCPDCGTWWAGFEHRCRQAAPATTTVTTGPITTDFTVRCTCPPNRGPLYKGTCPIHDIQVTYTGSLTSFANAIGGIQTYLPRGVRA